MKCLGQGTPISPAVETPKITLTRVRFTNEYAMRQYEINSNAEIEYDSNGEFNGEYNSDTLDNSNVVSSVVNEDIVNNNGIESISSSIENISSRLIRQYSVTHSVANSDVSELERNFHNIARSSSAMDHDVPINNDDSSSENGVVLISVHHYNDELPESTNSTDSANTTGGTTRGTSRQFTQTLDVIDISRSNRNTSSRSYDIAQDENSDLTEEVISMRLVRSALSEELMSRPPPSYDNIVHLTNGTYVKPLPPSYDSIFQTNKL